MYGFIHNVIAHPLLFFTHNAKIIVKLHDWSGKKMTVQYTKIKHKKPE